jgi:hypothetical protein
MPNKSDAVTGWGPLENLTVAALDYTRQHGDLPGENKTFTELALWLAHHAVALGVQQDSSRDSNAATAPDTRGEKVPTAEAMQRFQAVAQRLLGLNQGALPPGLQQPPELDVWLHQARQLWRSLPLPANAPAVRPQDCTVALLLNIQ